MKKIIISHSRIVLLIGLLFITMSCEDWLTPQPLSFYTPGEFDPRTIQATVIAAERNLRHSFFGDNAPIVTEFMLSDLHVAGTSDDAAAAINLDAFLIPSNSRLNSGEGVRVEVWWREGYRAIANANTVIAYIDQVNWASEAQRNNILGAALFQRAWRKFNLVHQFGDVPWIGEAISEPRLDFYTYCRWSILRQLRLDLEFAAEWVYVNPPRGHTTRGGAQVLLMKVYMALGYFDKAITLGHTIVANHPLMTERLPGNGSVHAPFQSPGRTNLMHDLHSIAGRESASNREGIMWMVSNPAHGSTQGSSNKNIMRNTVPFWAWVQPVFRIPGHPGVAGVQVGVPSGTRPPAFGGGAWREEDFGPFDQGRRYGRGVARIRPTHHFTHTIWGDGKHYNDMRSPHHTVSDPNSPYYGRRDSWRFPEDLIFNHQNLRYHSNPEIRAWYGQPVQSFGGMSVRDSTRAWFPWPHYKVFVPQPLGNANDWQGGATPWYLYRSAEVYLMLAECYYWLDNLAASAAMLNVVRERAGALPLTAADISIAAILNERARELFMEEQRASEITRIAFTYAKLGDRYGRACSVFGRVYSLTNFSGPGGVGTNYKGEGVNFFFDWVNKVNNWVNNKVIPTGAFTMSVHHVLWPIPDTAIDANTLGRINQNIGYAGEHLRLPPRVLVPVPPQ